MPRTFATGFTLYKGACAEMPETVNLYPGLALEEHEIQMFGKTYPVPRLTAWMGDAAYTYAGIRHEPAPLPAWLRTMRDKLEAQLKAPFDSVLANYYRNGRDSVSWHADDEPELGDHPVIASVSLGASRRFGIRRYDKSRPPSFVTLDHGDVLVMSGNSQRDWQHCLPKTPAAVGPRLNLTFRHTLAT